MFQVSRFTFHIVALTIFSYLLSPAIAAERPLVYFEATPQSVRAGEHIRVTLFIDSEEPVNAYEVTLAYPRDLLTRTGTNTSRSVIDIWQNNPEDSGGEVAFRGGGLTPFAGTRGELLTLRFKTIKAGEAVFHVIGAETYAADGQGTRLIPRAPDLRMSILPQLIGSATTSTDSAAEQDRTPPEIVFVAVIPDPVRPGERLLGFSAKDSDSGVSETLVRSLSWTGWSKWLGAENAIGLPLGAWAASVRAVDYEGNSSEKTVYDWGILARNIFIVLGALLAGAALINRVRVLMRPRKEVY